MVFFFLFFWVDVLGGWVSGVGVFGWGEEDGAGGEEEEVGEFVFEELDGDGDEE